MGTRLEAVLRAGEAHRQRAPVPTGTLEMEDFSDDALRLILDHVVSGNPKQACEAAADWCALNKRHRALCQDGGDALWTTLTRRIFGTDTQATTIDPSGNAQKNFYALCERAAAYRQGDRMIKDHPQDKRVRVFLNAAREGLDSNLSAAVENLGDSRQASWYSARKMDKALFSRKKDVYGVEEGTRHRDLLSWLLDHFAELFDNLAEFRRIRGPERDRTRTLVAKFFAHQLYFQVSLQDFESRVGYADKDDKLEVLYTFEEKFIQALGRAMVAVNFTGATRPRLNADAITSFYWDWVRDDIRYLVTQIHPDDEHFTDELLADAVYDIHDTADYSLRSFW
jgi:hypothetical protein